MQPHTPKVFGLGLSKIGATSLAQALEILGYKIMDYPGVTRHIAEDLSSINLEEIAANNALTDNPIPDFYQ